MLRDDSVVPRLSAGRGLTPDKYCSMQIISWQTGDTRITDFPRQASRFLAILVQYLNDELADSETDLLSAKDGMDVLDLGWKTVGTGDASSEVEYRWFAELLDNPRWGVVRFLQGADRELCKAVANAHRLAAEGQDVQWSDPRVSSELARAHREPLASLAMYVVFHLSVDSRLHWESAVRMACHANYYRGSSKYDRVFWTGAAVEGWRSLQAREATVERGKILCTLKSIPSVS